MKPKSLSHQVNQTGLPIPDADLDMGWFVGSQE